MPASSSDAVPCDCARCAVLPYPLNLVSSRNNRAHRQRYGLLPNNTSRISARRSEIRGIVPVAGLTAQNRAFSQGHVDPTFQGDHDYDQDLPGERVAFT